VIARPAQSETRRLIEYLWQSGLIMEGAAVVSLTFDDGLRCQFEKALPILDRYGIPATFFVIANQEQTHDRWSGHTNDWWKIDWRADDIAMLKELTQKGHEIGSHSVTHHPTQMPVQPDLESRESKRLIETWLGTKVSSFCYPFYRSHAYLAQAVKNAGYEQARGGGPPPKYDPRASYYTISRNGKLDLFNVHCRLISRNEDVNQWIRAGCWHVLNFHAIGDDRDGWEPITVGQFAAQIEELVRHRDKNSVEVVTFKQGAERARLRRDSEPTTALRSLSGWWRHWRHQ
jgi:peptidoglycan/xylan/chitin deacetylase (PgdA/CDA1 family)